MSDPSPGLRRLLQMTGVNALTETTLEAFLAGGLAALLFTGNAARYPEIEDLAVVMPELMKEFPGAFRIGVIDPDAERKLAARFKITVRPTLVFVKGGEVVLALPRMRDWAEYVREIAPLVVPTA
ncbi:hydrogenase [Acidocella sp.]|uniref:hydrogenase n=1 Tax=Acidocella sp. TaxID=50710 RepID=UPI00261A6B27|nr:hydrogenase [Acidocella sp.]